MVDIEYAKFKRLTAYVEMLDDLRIRYLEFAVDDEKIPYVGEAALGVLLVCYAHRDIETLKYLDKLCLPLSAEMQRRVKILEDSIK